MRYAIAIDGPAGAGKSTIARKAAKKLGFIYVDTGAMYRAMGLYFLRNEIRPEESDRIAESCDGIEVSITYDQGVQQVWLNGENVSEEIRREAVGNMASATAVNKRVREKLVALQQKLAQTADVVMDGRDIGTQVLPNATVKIYLTASVQERARRRFLELQEKGVSGNLEKIEEEIRERDSRDMNRELSPLRQAPDAVLIDASHLSIEEVTEAVIRAFEQRK